MFVNHDLPKTCHGGGLDVAVALQCSVFLSVDKSMEHDQH